MLCVRRGRACVPARRRSGPSLVDSTTNRLIMHETEAGATVFGSMLHRRWMDQADPLGSKPQPDQQSARGDVSGYECDDTHDHEGDENCIQHGTLLPFISALRLLPSIVFPSSPTIGNDSVKE
jgi:hypothetical protein